MLFLYELFLKVLYKLKLGSIVYPICKRISRIFNVRSLPNVGTAKYVVSKNTLNKSLKERKISFKHDYSDGKEYDIQIVIPVYNSEKYLRDCLNSVINQRTDYKYQIIIVNDGSTDNSNEILKQYSNNPLIRIITEKNYGSSVARNMGLRFVNSKYVMFVDSDDKLAPGAIQKLLNEAYKANADVVLGGSYTILFNHITRISGVVYHHHDELNLKASNYIDGGPSAKIFRSSLFNKVYFPVGYTFEDMMIFFLIYPRCKKISSINSRIYCYRYNMSSVSHKFKFSNASVDSFLLLNCMIKSLRSYNIKISQYIYETFLNQVHATGMRNIYINTKIQKSIFVLICCLYDKYFKGFSTNINSNAQLERSLKNKDYMSYILFCIMK